MSEYMEQHTVARLIGAPPGYVGHEEGGQLTEAIRRRPYSVVLFDEVEKAHKNVFNVLLQVLDDGRLTDGQGRTVDFSNVVVIMTSNLGAEFLLRDLKIGDAVISPDTKDKVIAEVKRNFRPEFLNRLDDIIIFNPLSKTELCQIVRIQLQSLGKRLEDKHIKLELTEKGLNVILTESYNPVYGARPIRRYLEKNVGTALSRLLVAEELLPYSTVYLEEKSGGGINYRIQAGKPPRRSASSERNSSKDSNEMKD